MADRPTKVKSLNKAFTLASRRLSDNAAFTLFKHYPYDLYQIVLSCPSDSELAYLALSQRTDVVECLTRTIPALEKSLYAFWWELHDRLSLHVHILINIPGVSDKLENIERAIHMFWYDYLDQLDEETGCDPFFNADGSDCSTSVDNAHVFISQFRERQNQNDYPWAYFTTPKKHGKYSRTSRCLSMLGNERVSPLKHSGVAPELLSLVEKTTYTLRLPLMDRNECQVVAGEFQELLTAYLPAIAWLPLRAGELYFGCKCRVRREEFDLVADFLTLFAQEHKKCKYPSPARAYELVIKLSPNRFLKIYPNKIQRGAQKGSSTILQSGQRVGSSPASDTGRRLNTWLQKGAEYYVKGFTSNAWKDAAHCIGCLFWVGNPSLGIEALGENDAARFAAILKVFEQHNILCTEQMREFIWEKAIWRKRQNY
ncbi:MAG: hypothetical protein KGS72_21815 [Cyanobacteria bacterium REEB67]|nr:hypothetical protein [Cyanobacteria bacterium REEB67]